MANETKGTEIPHELRSKISALDKALTGVENKFDPLLKVSQIELNTQLNSLDKAKLDLVAAYSINSLFWMYLNVCGVNPKDHGIKQELDRIRGYMNRVKEIQDKEKAPKLDVSASKRFVKSALWQAAQKDGEAGPSFETPSKSEEGDRTPGKSEEGDRTETVNKSGKKGKKRKSEAGRDRKKRNPDKVKKHYPGRYMDTSID